jgi:ATP-dependent helicase/nuclease subunit B
MATGFGSVRIKIGVMIESVHFAPYYSHLEEKLAREIGARPSSLSRRAILLVPSSAIRRRLAILLAEERGIALLNVAILTFHQLALRVAESTEPPADDFLFEEALRHRLRRQPSAFSPLTRTTSGCTALWRTLRDLKEAQIHPPLLLQAIREGFIGPEAGAFSRLYANHAAARQNLPDQTDAIRSAIERLPETPFLNTVDPVYFYGFYDLTQIEIDFLEAVCKRFRTILFFPLAYGDPSWRFAQRFYERRLIGLVPPTVKPPQCLDAPVFSAATTIIACADPDGELRTVAREIVRLVETERFDPDEIGVVADRLSHELLTPLTDLFRHAAIPTLLAADRPLSDFPYVQSLLRLGGLLSGGFSRPEVLALLSDAQPCSSPDTLPRIDLWESVTRRLGIVKGWEQWKRLARHLKKAEGDDLEEIAHLWRAVSRLHAQLSALPLRASWSRYVDLWKGVINGVLAAPKEEGGETFSGTPQNRRERQRTPSTAQQSSFDPQQVFRGALSFLDSLTLLDRVCPAVDRAEFLDTFCRGLRRATVPWGGEKDRGVQVCDAVTARGLCFRALFIIGMAERSFPRIVREDPFLRDPVRRAVETTLGNKLDEKMAGVDEERLQFALLAGSARERLYCLYSRSDASGNPQSPSIYLDEIRRRATTLSERRAGEKADAIRGNLLPPEEMALQQRLAGKEAGHLLPVSQRVLYQRGRRVMAAQEGESGLTPYDGLPGQAPALILRRDGLTPTGLVRYATCPFRFFATQILNLRPVREEAGEMSAPDKGILCHQILATYYRRQIQGPAPLAPPSLREVAQGEMTAWAIRHPVVYETAWEAQQERLTRMLERVVAEEEAEATGFRPAFIERACDGVIGPFPISGRIDRIDTAADRYRIIDYKYTEAKSPPTPHPLDTLQLGIYRQLTRPHLDLPNVEAAFHHLMPNRPEGPLKISTFGKTEEEVEITLKQLASDLDAGLFFILPGSHCHACGIKSVCRKNHAPSRHRAERDPLTQPHRTLK